MNKTEIALNEEITYLSKHLEEQQSIPEVLRGDVSTIQARLDTITTLRDTEVNIREEEAHRVADKEAKLIAKALDDMTELLTKLSNVADEFNTYAATTHLSYKGRALEIVRAIRQIRGVK